MTDIDIDQVDAVAANIAGTLQAGIIAGGNVTYISLEDEGAARIVLEHFRRLLGDPAVTPRATRAAAFALSGDETLVITDAFADEARRRDNLPALDRYLLHLTKQWQEQKRRYVPLKAAVKGDDDLVQPDYSPVQRTEQGILKPREPYPDVREAAADYRLMTLVGEPGSGKTTALQVLALDTAQEAARSEGALLPLFARLADYRYEQDPRAFLEARWRLLRAPGALPDRLIDGRMVLLLDGLNEMRWTRENPYEHWLDHWQLACQEWAECGNRVVFTCRTLDHAPVRAPEMQDIYLERFDPERIQKFLRRYLDDDSLADDVFQQLREAPAQYKLLDLFGVPFYLSLLVDVVQRGGGELPHTRAALFTRVVRESLLRELDERRNPHLTEALLNKRGRDHLRGQPPGFLSRFPHYLADHPDEDAGRLTLALSALALYMQADGVQGEAGGRRLHERQVREALAPVLADHEAQDHALHVGADINVLEKDDLEIPPLWAFRHHQLQEYFAARDLVRQFRAGKLTGGSLWAVRWRADELEPLDPRTLGRGQRYPTETETTGWEETTVLAAGLLAWEPPLAAAFARDVLRHNPVLAARCLLEVTPRPNRYAWPPFAPELEAVAQATRAALLARLTDPQADRRARLGAGFALGELGDPRFPVERTPDGVAYIAPQWVTVPGGMFTMGDDESGFEWEGPAHPQTVSGFRMAAYPVTVAEYACFVAAGGYQDARWWEGDGDAWRRGDLGGAGETWVNDMAEIRRVWRPLGERRVQEILEDWRDNRGYSDADLGYIEKCALLDDAAFREYQEEIRAWAERRGRESVEQPAWWDEIDFANPSQPVVGVSWYEARAYCAWLSACLGRAVRLPTEVEWERAARGPEGWPRPWGKGFDADRANTVEGRVRRTSPVGAYPQGASIWQAGELHDLAGNAYEWTVSLWGEDPASPTTGKYPYQADDGREDVNAHITALRVVRGGAWLVSERVARCASRGWYSPVDRYDYFGFRVVSASPI